MALRVLNFPHIEVDQLYDQCKNCGGEYHD